MKKIKISILKEGCGCPDLEKGPMSNTHNQEEARMHRTTLAHLMADTKVLLDLIEDADDLPEWLETKITKAGDYMSSAARYIAGNEARSRGQLEEQESMVNMSMEREQMIQTLMQLTDSELARLLGLADLDQKVES